MDSLTLPIFNSELSCKAITDAIDEYASCFWYDVEAQQGLIGFKTREQMEAFCDLMMWYKDIINWLDNIFYSQ